MRYKFPQHPTSQQFKPSVPPSVIRRGPHPLQGKSILETLESILASAPEALRKLIIPASISEPPASH